MADINIPTNDASAEQAHVVAPPTRTNDQKFSSSKWVPIGKSNCILDVQKSQRNPIFSIVVAILKNTNFFRAFMTSSTILAIYIQQFWDTICFNSSTGLCSCHLDEQWFNLYKDVLRDVLRDEQWFVGKDGREIFGMLIPNALLTDEIKGAPYYGEYQEHVAKPARPVVIRELDSGRIQPLPDVQGKGKKKVIDEQAAHDLLTLLTPKNKSLVDQFIFQRRTPMLTEASGHVESPFLDAELALTDSEMESDNAGPNLGVQDEGQAGLNPGDVAESQPQLSHAVHAGPNLEHMELKATDASTQQNLEQMDEEFTTTSYPNVQENLKLPSEDSVILEEPARSTGTMSSLQNLKKELSFTDRPGGKVGQTWAAAVQIGESQHSSPGDLPTVDMKEILQQRMFEDKSYEAHEDHKKLYDVLENSLERDYSDQLLSDLEEARQKKRKRHDLPRTPSGSSPPQPPPPPPLAGTSGAPGTSGASGSSQLPQPPFLLSTGTSGSAQQQGSEALSLSKSAASAPQSMAWTTFDTRYESAGISGTYELSLTDSLIQDDSILDEQVHFSDDEDSGNDHLPKADSRKDWWKPLPEEEIPATPEPAWTIPSSTISDVENNWAIALVLAYETPAENSLLAKTGDMMNFLNWYCRQVKKIALTTVDLEGKSYEVVKAFHPSSILTYMLLRRVKKKSDQSCGFSVSSELKPTPDMGHLDHHPGSDKRMLSTAVKLWTRNLLIWQRVEDFQLGIESYQTQLNLTKPGWDATGYEFKHDYTIIESPRAVVFPVNNNERKIMRVKEFKIKQLNPGMNTRFWTQKDVTRSKEFIAAIERRLETIRIYRNLECFVGGRVRGIDYRLLQRTE
nr:hypothetical protein [Tanacetum cinerariifolium]